MTINPWLLSFLVMLLVLACSFLGYVWGRHNDKPDRAYPNHRYVTKDVDEQTWAMFRHYRAWHLYRCYTEFRWDNEEQCPCCQHAWSPESRRISYGLLKQWADMEPLIHAKTEQFRARQKGH